MSERNWWAVMFGSDGHIHTARTPTANYIRCEQLIYQDGRRYHEAHVEAADEAEAIATAREVLRTHYGFGEQA